ncbi:MAG: hypothetical protein ACYDG4_13310 [Desulfuromonadaceae bacterium]
MQAIDIIKLVFMALYSSGVTAASFYFFFRVTFTAVPEDNQQYANLILGFLIGSAISTFLGYYFGTSQSTKVRPPDLPLPTEVRTTETRTTETKTDPKE